MRIAPTVMEWEKLSPGSTTATPSAPSPSFGEELKSKLKEIDGFQHQAEDSMQEGAVNGAEKIHETMIQIEEADIGLRMLVKVRNKALEAYQEVMRMQF